MVNIFKPELTNLQQGIFRLLCVKAGTSLNARAIARFLNVSQPAISKSLPDLERKGLVKVKKDKESGRFSIELNRERHEIIWLKRTVNLKQLYESGLIQLFYDTFPSANIILFGSYSFGEDTLNSDIDVAIIGAKEKNIILKEFEKVLERRININYYDSLKKLNKHFLNNLLNGIILKGAIEL